MMDVSNLILNIQKPALPIKMKIGVFIQNRVRSVNKQFYRKKKKIPLCIICLNTLGVLAQTCRCFLYVYGTESNKAEGN